MQQRFKSGDKVRVIFTNSRKEGEILTISEHQNKINNWHSTEEYGAYYFFLEGGSGAYDIHLELVESKNNIMTNLKSKFKNLFRPEPEKSFIKAGIMDESQELTQEGKDIFLNWLFEQNKEEFNTEIVQKLLASESKESSK